MLAGLAALVALAGALFGAANAQYSASAGYACDSSRLIRCQQEVLRDMQTVAANAASVQYPLSGPPYSPRQLQQQQLGGALASAATCRLVRANLDCLLVSTPACYEFGIQAAQNTDIILRAKRFLEQNNCNQPDTSWQSTFCYRSTEVRNCEDRYGFSASAGFASSAASAPLTINATACLAYQAFRHCIESHLRLSCKVHEMDMANEYLIDRASDLAWRCPPNSSAGAYTSPGANPYVLGPSSVGAYSAGGHFRDYEQRPLPTYVGSSSGSLNLFGSSHSTKEQAWERFRNPQLDDPNYRFGLSRFPSSVGSSSGTGDVFERLVASNGFDTLDSTSDCPVRAAPYARECEETLLEQQRLARDSRDGNELQRRICCSLFQYRDCISRVVLDRCADSSTMAVEILMGHRRREMTFSCRSTSRDVCSAAPRLAAPSSPTLILLLACLLSLLAVGPRKVHLL